MSKVIKITDPKILKKLGNDAHYYGDFGKRFVSNSDIGALLNAPNQFKQNQESLPMLIGRYFHCLLTEPEKCEEFLVVDASTRNTNIYKDARESAGAELLLLQKEVEAVNSYVAALTGNMDIYELIYGEDALYEQPAVIELHGIQWKGKTDILRPALGRQFDAKTTGELAKFKWSAIAYNYDSAAYLYEEMFGCPLEFLVVDKNTLQIAHFTCSRDFVRKGKEKVAKAAAQWHKFFGPDATLDVDDFYIQDIL